MPLPIRRALRLVALATPLAALLTPATLPGQQSPAATAQRGITIERLFRRGEFGGQAMPSVDWLRDGRSYLDLRAERAGGGASIVRVDVVTGAETVLAPASALVGGDGRRLEIEELTLSADETKALLFHDAVRVWRTNSRGVYHVYDFATRKLTPIVTSVPAGRPSADTDTSSDSYLGKAPSFLGRGLASGAADPSLQQFAKFSPDGQHVAFVRGNDLWTTELATGRTTRLTTDGSDDIINGTTDWVYEEELGIADAFRWSPDSRRVAYWRFDQSQVPAFPIIDELGTYPVVSVLRYPKAGYPNSKVKVGVVDAAGGATRWLEVGGDTGLYLARMDWVGADSLAVQRLTRRQDRNDLLLLSATSGRGRTMYSDVDKAYVDVNDGPVWIAGERRFLWLTDRSGWRAVTVVDRARGTARQVTPQGIDVLGIVAVDEARGMVYVQAAAPTPTQRQVYRASLDGKKWERVTMEAGSHALQVAPGARYAVHVRSTLGVPSEAHAVELPALRRLRTLADNQALRTRIAAEGLRQPELFRVPTPSGLLLDAYRITPPGFDSTRKYPVLMHTYGGPASPRVVDQWGGSQYLWHQMLAQRGFVIVVVDNRGSAWRGNEFRKVTQLQLGKFEVQDQVDAARWLKTQSWVDDARIGIWGWSYGGYMATMAAARGGDLFRAAIAVAPVTDWRLYDTIYTERFMWTPQENKQGYDSSAPSREAAGITARFLLVHGTGDDNVHSQNATQLAEAMIRANRPFTELFYPNRTHSISGGNATAHLFAALTRFVEENLAPAAVAVQP